MKNKEEIRFEFGENWLDYSNTINSQVKETAKRSLSRWLPFENLEGKKFLDIGSGSGLFSLAAWDLGAEEVFSFDYDSNSVIATKQLRETAIKADNRTWQVEKGNVLESRYMKQFHNKYDVVYSWGVLHHTGNMERALAEAGRCVSERGGVLFISIYNDQGVQSRIWKEIKKWYNIANEKQKETMLLWLSLIYNGYKQTKQIYGVKGKAGNVFGKDRGMNLYNDWVDWVGGYPFEYAATDKIIDFYLHRGFKLSKMVALGKTAHGCNQFLFEKN